MLKACLSKSKAKVSVAVACIISVSFVFFYSSLNSQNLGVFSNGRTWKQPEYLKNGTIDPTDEGSELFLNERRKEYERRKDLVHSACEKYNETLSRLDDHIDQLRWERKSDLSYCIIEKAGSTTWLHHFFKILDVPELEEDWAHPHGYMHDKIKILDSKPNWLNKNEWKLLQKHSFKFVFVRHPFVRIVSAFQDKVLAPVKRHEEVSQFPGFISANLWSRRFRTDPGIPTFYEFAEYIILNEEIRTDDHIRPFWDRCDFCRIDYDVIGKMESYKEDTRYILEMTGLIGILNYEDKHHQSLKPSSGSGRKMSSEELAHEYFKPLNKSTVTRMFDLYKIDFEMFGYSMNEYI